MPKKLITTLKLFGCYYCLIAFYTILSLAKVDGYYYYPEAKKSDLKVIKVYNDFRSPEKEISLLEEAAEAYFSMYKAAAAENIELLPISGFRSSINQQRIFKSKAMRFGRLAALKTVAPPGYSEHHTGYALDFAYLEGTAHKLDKKFIYSPQYKWLIINAKNFGFELSYAGDTKGTNFEPWHWRYIGSESAKSKFNRNHAMIVWDLLANIFN